MIIKSNFDFVPKFVTIFSCNPLFYQKTQFERNAYEGEFKKGKIDGQGTYTYKSGDTFKGECYAGSKSGYGVYTSKSGDRYEGPFKSNKMNGKGGDLNFIR
jgi:hypothetical protein